MLHYLVDHFGRLWMFGALPVVLPLVLWGWHRRQITLRHPSLKPHAGKVRRFSFVLLASYLALSSVVVNGDIVLMQPRRPAAVVQHIERKRNVCLAGDRSGSMESILLQGLPELSDDEAKADKDPNAKTVSNGGNDKTIIQTGPGYVLKPQDLQPGKMTRVVGMYLAMRYLIRHRMTDNPDETDRFCIMTFDTATYIMAPLSTDKNILLLRTEHLLENVGGGTNFFGPSRQDTDVGPLQKAVDFFAKYTEKDNTNVLILVTDGYDDADPLRIQQLMTLYEQNHIHLYVIGLGDGWKEGNDLDLQKFADALHKVDPTSGIVFRAQNPDDMKKAMETIDRLERKQEVVQSIQTYNETPFWFIVAMIGSAFAFLFFTLLSRRIP